MFPALNRAFLDELNCFNPLTTGRHLVLVVDARDLRLSSAIEASIGLMYPQDTLASTGFSEN